METTEYVAKRIAYNYASIEDKHYFGGFLNLAQNNIEAIFKAFGERFKKENIWDFFKEDTAIAEYENGIDFLKQHLPVINYLYLPINHNQFEQVKKLELTNEQRNHFGKSLKALLKLLNDLRNFYTHHYHDPIVVSEDTYRLIDTIFLAVVSDVKKHRMKSDASQYLLKKNLLSELEKLEELKTDEMKELKRQGKKVNLHDKEAIRNGVLNDGFYHLLYKKKANQNYSATLKDGIDTENGITISESGVLFVLSMFLTKKQSEDLRSHIKGFKAKLVVNPDKPIDKKNNSLKYMATHWVFGYLGFKGVKNRFTTTFEKDILLAQIIDELSKVPNALYEVLDEIGKQEFIEDVNEYLKIGNETTSLKEATVIHPVIRKRYEDKFAYFALRYLDEFVDFPTLRFQLHLGNYIHDERMKHIEGTQYVTERVVKEKIKVCSKLSEATQLKQEYLATHEDVDGEGLKLYPNPSYNFVGNNIPIYVNLLGSHFPGESKKVANLLKNNLGEYKSNNIEEYKERKKDKINPESLLKSMGQEKTVPVAMLSLNELPALMHEVLINNKTGEEIEILIAEKIVERYNTLINFKAGDEFHKGQIPKNLHKASEQEKVDVPKLIRAINKEIKITEAKLELITRNNNEVEDRKHKRKYVFTNKELGREATWLADDLKRFMPKESRENWRGHHHSHLQQSLAYYNTHTDEAYKLLREFWDFNKESITWNEAIKNAFTKKDFETFYMTYLNGRKELLGNFSSQLKGFQTDKKRLNSFLIQQNIWNLFYKRLYVIDTLSTQVNKLLVKPLHFPRGIFDKKPTYIKGKNIEETPECFANWYVNWNAHQDYQQFYHWSRDYKSAYEASDKQKKEQRFTRMQQSQIIKTQQKDFFLVNMASNIFNKLYGSESKELIDFKLSAIYKTRQERKGEDAKALKQSNRSTGDSAPNIIKSSSAWTITVPYKSTNLYEPNVKLKELGKFKRFLTDEKVQRLWEYFPNKVWIKLELEQELELIPNSYEVIRRDYILKEIQEFEKYILDNDPELMDNKYPNFKNYVVSYLNKQELVEETEVSWLKQKTENDFDETPIAILKEKSETIQKAFLLIVVRNKFAHNQLPAKIYYEEISKRVPNSEKNSVSELYLQFLKQTVLSLKN